MPEDHFQDQNHSSTPTKIERRYLIYETDVRYIGKQAECKTPRCKQLVGARETTMAYHLTE
jgi:hypothetical protein